MPADKLLQDHYQFLSELHSRLAPRAYLETGVETGATLALCRSIGIGIDPTPIVSYPLGESAMLFAETSDDFFDRRDVLHLTKGFPIELAFIDGLHLFEAALRDFMNIEAFSAPWTVVCVHDVLPMTIDMARREPQADGWTGDVFGLSLALRQYRPDLFVSVIDLPHTGMLVIGNLDPDNHTLSEKFDTIVARHAALDYARIHERRNEIFEVSDNYAPLLDYLEARAMRARFSEQETRSRMRLKQEGKTQIGIDRTTPS